MYRLTGFRLHNICQHADLSVSLGPGLVAVIGANGVGKTNCMRGLVYALTGLVDGLWGNQQTLQRDFAPDIGYAEATFDGGGVSYRIRRYATSSVKFPDVVINDATKDVVAQRRQKVNEFMEGVFGMPCQLMFQVCWGRQGELAMLLKSTPAMVGAFLQQVFDMKPLERLREKLKLQMDTIAILPQNMQAVIDSDKAELAALPDADRLEASIASLTKAVDDLTALKTDLETAMSGGVSRASKEEQERRLVASIQALDAQLADLPADLPEDARDPGDISAELVDAVSEQTALITRRNHLKWTREAQETAVEDVDKRRREFNSRRTDIDARLVPPADGICAFCGGKIGDLYRYADNMVNAVTGYESQADYAKHVDDELTQFELERSLALENIDKVRKEELKVQESLDSVDARCKALEAERAVAVLVSRVKQRRLLEEQLADIMGLRLVDDSTPSRYAETCSLLSQSKDGLKAAVSQLADSKARREMLEKAIAENEAALKQYEINSEARQVLSDIRDALSQQRAQARYLKSRIRCINVELARYLGFTGMPFSLRLDETTRTFVFTTHDGSEHPAAHLSGAQQAMSAVALQMALFAVMRPNMNLYVIDEPTEALDVVNKAVMASMFERMNSMLPSVEGTMLIITRDAPVVQSCGQILEIKEGEQ